MAPNKGNQFWKLRSKHGRDKLFAEPHLLKEACEEYFEWVEDNPLEEERIFSFQGQVNKGKIEKLRAMTISGLCIFLDINQDTWCTWRKSEDKDYSEVIAWADEVIYTQKLTGAAADMLNANIIARELNLKETVNNNIGGQPNNPIVVKSQAEYLKGLNGEQIAALRILASGNETSDTEPDSD